MLYIEFSPDIIFVKDPVEGNVVEMLHRQVLDSSIDVYVKVNMADATCELISKHDFDLAKQACHC